MAEGPPWKDRVTQVPPEGALDQTCTDQVLNDIALDVAEWETVAALLGLSRPERMDIVSEHSHSPRMQKIAMFEKWKAKFGNAATYRKLTDVFWKLNDCAVIEKIVQLLRQEQQSATESLKGSVLEKYQEFLKGLYCERSAEYLLHWPPVPHYKYVDLSMTIPKDKVRYRTPDAQHTMAVMRGKIEWETPRNVELCEIFKKDPSQHKKILIEGAPGSGKTTITWHICKQWGLGEMFNDLFDVVVLVQLRDPAVHSAQSLVELLPRSPSDNGIVADALLKAEGEKSLVIYDGLDELPRQSKCYEWLLKLLDDPSSVGLAKSSVIITSRPSASVDLHTKVSSRIEIQGFAESKRIEYFKECCDDVDALMHQLSSKLYLLSVCYLPLNCAIVAHLFRALHNLPSTNGEFFFLLVCNCIFRYIKKEIPKSTVKELSSLNELPSQLVSPFRSICNLALDGIIKDKILFSSKDLIASDLATEKPLGLLHVVQSLVSCGTSFTCNFPHLSMQEYLAAYCISQIPSESKRCNTMKAITNKDRFSAVFLFFASITKLKTECDISLFKKFLPLCKEYKNSINDFVAVLHEAQSEALCQYTSEVFGHRMGLNANLIFDYVSVGYFLYAVCLSDGVFHLSVGMPRNNRYRDDVAQLDPLLSLLRELYRLCSIKGRELKGSIHLEIVNEPFLVPRYKSFLPVMRFALNPPFSHLTLSIPCQEELLMFLKMLRNCTSLVFLEMIVLNPFTNDIQQLKQYISSALVCNEALKSLIFVDYYNNYEGSLCRAVMQNCSLEELGLFLFGSSDCQTFLQMLPQMNLKRARLGITIHPDYDILKNVRNALVANTSLLYLHLMFTWFHMKKDCFVPADFIESLSIIVSKNRTLKELVVNVEPIKSQALGAERMHTICSFRLPTEFYHTLASELLEATSTNTVLESITLDIPSHAHAYSGTLPPDIKSTLQQKLYVVNAKRTQHGLTTLGFNFRFL